VRDDAPTVCAVSVIAGILGDIIHEGLGHGLTALLTVAPSGTLSTVAWSSEYESKLVAAGGTIANLIAGGIFWLVLRRAKTSSPATRLFWLLCCAFNLFTGTGYFFFSGVSNFGDWAAVIAGMHPYMVWRITLIVVGVLSYWAAIVIIGTGMVRDVGVPLDDTRRFFRLTFIPYISAVVLATLAGLMNPLGVKLVFLSALPATAGGECGLLWMRWYILKNTVPRANPEPISRSWAWIVVSAVLALAFIFILGRGITLHR
jgi:hypothetical protein